MEEKQKARIMADTAQQLVDIIQKRIKGKLSTLNTIESFNLIPVPDEVKQMREIEARVIRNVMEEQTDLIEIIKILFPTVNALDVVTEKQTPAAAPKKAAPKKNDPKNR